MTKLSPHAFDIHLKYLCPECRCDIWVSELEARTPNFKVSCCNTIYTMDTVSNLRVGIQFGNSKVKSKKAKKQEHNLDKFVSPLTSVGYSKDEAKELVEKVLQDNPLITDVNEVVKFALAKVVT